jgi:hypothetical protein
MKIKIIEHTDWQGNTTEHVIIDKGNGNFISMPKVIYDQQQGLTELVDE